MVYNLNVVGFFSIKWFKSCSGLKAKPFTFDPIELQKNLSY